MNAENSIFFFNNLNKSIQDDRFSFMNHGYYPAYPQYTGLFKYSESLYHNLLEGVPKSGSILDVGCGHGGGANLFKKLGYDDIQACDVVPSNIEYCKNLFPDISYKVSDALNLQYEDASFDVITNLESSNYYSSYKNFYLEVKRVLKPEGIFAYADISLNVPEHISSVERKTKLLNKLFSRIDIIDISENVGQACKFHYQEINQIEDCPLKSFFVELYQSKVELYESKRISFVKYICKN